MEEEQLKTEQKYTKEYACLQVRRAGKYILTFIKWMFLAALNGLVCGGAGCLFHTLIELATDFRTENSYIIYFLPIGGLVIVLLYRLFKEQNVDGTNYVIRSIRTDGKVPFGMAPAILSGTVITHLLGGSAGREGAALQLGGSLGSTLGKLFRLDDKDMHVMVLCGMSAVFSALFATPLTAVVFVMEVISVGTIYYSAIMPCIFSSVTAYLLTVLLKIEPIGYSLANVPDVTAASLLQTAAMGVLFALISIALCVTISKTHLLFNKVLKNDFVRAAAGGALIVGLTFLCGTDYNGAGMNIVNKAIADGEVFPAAFALKLVFTAITLASGFRGGEIVPTFFIGSTFGCAVAPLLGLDAGFGAALGLVAVFCGATNAPLASLFLSIELFGGAGIPFFAIACGVSYMLSGYFSLYKSQIIVYDKLKAIFTNRRTR